jgi:hypothetical protein
VKTISHINDNIERTRIKIRMLVAKELCEIKIGYNRFIQFDAITHDIHQGVTITKDIIDKTMYEYFYDIDRC